MAAHAQWVVFGGDGVDEQVRQACVLIPEARVTVHGYVRDDELVVADSDGRPVFECDIDVSCVSVVIFLSVHVTSGIEGSNNKINIRRVILEIQ